MSETAGVIGPFSGEYRFLSNFWPSQMVAGGTVYPTVEHYYQCAKAATNEDWRRVWDCRSAAEAKRMGRKVTIRADWDAVRKQVMLTGLLAKFSQCPELRHNLLATAPALLVEVNTWGDRYWGAEMVWGSLDGENWLGRLLMMVRDVLGLPVRAAPRRRAVGRVLGWRDAARRLRRR